MRWFADRGWMGVTVDYVLSADQRHLWDLTEAQVGCALVWVAEHARDLGGDPTRLALAGDSTGGNVALNVAYKAAQGTLESSCGGKVPVVESVSTLYPAVDPAAMYEGVDADLGAVRRRMVAAYTGGSPEEFPDRYRRITPAGQLGRGSPPTLIVTGEADHFVPVEGVRRFADQARAAGVEVEFVPVPYADHGFDLRLPGSIGQQAYQQLTLNWLRKHDRRLN
jgi:acetyl esterase/lipase